MYQGQINPPYSEGKCIYCDSDAYADWIYEVAAELCKETNLLFGEDEQGEPSDHYYDAKDWIAKHHSEVNSCYYCR